MKRHFPVISTMSTYETLPGVLLHLVQQPELGLHKLLALPDGEEFACHIQVTVFFQTFEFCADIERRDDVGGRRDKCGDDSQNSPDQHTLALPFNATGGPVPAEIAGTLPVFRDLTHFRL